MTDISIILWISVAMQCLAVFLALRLIPLTRRATAWIILSAAFLLMAARRTISLLYREGYLQDSWLHAFSTEIVALTISLLIVSGVFLIKKVFIQQQVDSKNVRTLSLAVEQNPGVTIIVNTDGRIDYVNSTYCRLSGNNRDEVEGRLPDILNPEFADKATLKQIWTTLKMGQAWEGEIQNKYTEGHLRWERARISPVKNDRSETTHYVIICEDITKQREQLEQLEYMALHDDLTNLPNRALFNDRLEHAIISAKRDKDPLAVMLMDLNNFKEINDTMGHHVGDAILKEIGNRLLNVIRGGDTVARMGGDEFLIVLPSAGTTKRTEFIKRITSILEKPFLVGDRNFEISASIGLALYPDDGDDPEMLLKHADVAMYAAKNAGQIYRRYDKSYDEGISGRLELTNSIRHAIELEQFKIHYQPLLHIPTRQISGVEALIRWNHPTRGLLYPDSFIQISEQSNHIIAITEWVIKKTFSDLAGWLERGHELHLSINISARDLNNPKLSEIISNQINDKNLPESKITLEITESALMMHTNQTLENLINLREIGVNLVIDDFGTGYSSLQYLKRFPVSGLKIDKSFVMNMTHDDNDAIIVRSTTDLGHNMGLMVVAEGIDRKEVYDLVEILGCNYGQGYYISKPMEHDLLLQWIEDFKNNNRLKQA